MTPNEHRNLQEARRAFRLHGGVEPDIVQPASWYWQATVALMERKLVRLDLFRGDSRPQPRDVNEGLGVVTRLTDKLRERGWKPSQCLLVLLTAAAEHAVAYEVPLDVFLDGALGLYELAIADTEGWLRDHKPAAYDDWMATVKPRLLANLDPAENTDT